ncbi:hypothetical protein BKA82DRAFT_513533 [Pisolithus tinctorius]|uniref:Uncharacterized protein n=1 Tax=Pisolithus tinctorius Marx 270 TaxID=870435 RepID=A0A0C3PC99_PISTI|nr:hypothetical protein BKA82DRAFT_513533 [Pisolithus tinctorius]KIO05656.1 hypothetical protein M404DRAFT_513533 [Pisolithus tinctorius Marx 270]
MRSHVTHTTKRLRNESWTKYGAFRSEQHENCLKVLRTPLFMYLLTLPINIGIVIDVHVHRSRVTNRLGWYRWPMKNPEGTR